MTAQTRLTPSQRRTLAHLRDSHALGMSALSLQQFADLLALRDQGLAVFSGSGSIEQRGMGAHGLWRPAGDVWGDAR